MTEVILHKPFARLRFTRGARIWKVAIVLALSAVFIPAVWAQKEVTSKTYRSREREKSTGRYERYEAKPRLY